MTGMPFLEWLLSFSNFAVMIGANLMVQSTIIITAGICAAYVLRKKGAAVQSLVLRMFLVAVLISPVVASYFSFTGISGVTFDIPKAFLNGQGNTHISDLHGNTALTLTQAGEHQNNLPEIDGGSKKLDTMVINGSKESSPESLNKPGSLHLSIPPNHETSLSIQPWELNNNRPEPANGMEWNYNVEIPLTPFIAQEHMEESPDLWKHKLSGIYIIFTVTWLVSSLCLLIRLLSHTVYTQYIRHSAFIAKPSFIKLCKDLAQESGIEAPLVFQSPSIKSPFLSGFFKPFILLPLGEHEVSLASREVFLHELSHLRRYDHLWNLLKQIGTVILPFQPLMWILSRRIEETSDYVCDDYVMNYTGNHRSYAVNLLNIARFYQPGGHEITAGVGIISFKSPLRRRIERILDSSHPPTVVLKANARMVIYILFLCAGTVFSSGFIGFERKSFARPGMASENISRSEGIVNTENTTPVESVNEINNAVSYGKVVKANLTETPPSEKFVSNSSDAEIHYGNSPVNNVSSLNEKQTIENKNEVFNSRPENNSGIDEQVIRDGTLAAGFASSNLSETEDYPGEFPRDSAYDTDDKSSIKSENIAIETLTGESDEITGQDNDDSDIPSFVTRSSGMTVPSFRDTRIKMPVAKPVNVEIDFDYENFDFDLKNKEDRRLYNLYLGLDKYKNEPAWSPDGKWIAFTDHNRIWIVSSGGGEPELIYENFQEGYSVGNFESLCFTPDSQEITFKKDIYDIERGSFIFVQEYKGEGFATFSNPIPNIESVNIYTGEHRIIVEDGYRCCWSTSGRYLCYLNWDPAIYSANPETDHHGKPAVYDAGTSRKWFLPVDKDKRYGKPTFSLDDSHVVIPVRDGSGPIELYRIPLDEGEPEQLTFYDENDGHGKYINFPEYSPDGQWILYTDFTWNKTTPDKRLFVYNIFTGEISEVFENPDRRNSYGKWSPDGKQICYLVEEEDGNYIYICDFALYTPFKPAIAETSAPVSFTLNGNYPNPFNVSTTIQFSLPSSGFVTLVIYNSMGQKVSELVSEQMTQGVHSVRWNGSDESGSHVSSGVYFTQLRMGNKTSAGRMTLLK